MLPNPLETHNADLLARLRAAFPHWGILLVRPGVWVAVCVWGGRPITAQARSAADLMVSIAERNALAKWKGHT